MYVCTKINYIGKHMYVQTRVAFEILTLNIIWKQYGLSTAEIRPQP